jgi:glycosyltransferase involved in cell wall biosynthesis
LAIATPIKQAANYLENYQQIIDSLAYPKELIELCFVTSDSDDGTNEALQECRKRWQHRFRKIQIEEVNFGFHPTGPRWQVSIQRRRRSNIARCRNRLVELASDSDYVLFLDVDLAHVPTDIVQSLLGAEAPVVMANCVDELDRVFDLNSFFYEHEPTFNYKWKALKDGLFQPAAKWPRMYLSDVAYLNKVPLDCVGGTCLLVEQSVYQSGVRFPEEPFRYHIETEGFSLLARERGFEVLGLPNVKVVHPRQ